MVKFSMSEKDSQKEIAMKLVRKHLKFKSQKEIALETGVNTFTISRIARNEGRPNPKTAQKIIDTYIDLEPSQDEETSVVVDSVVVDSSDAQEWGDGICVTKRKDNLLSDPNSVTFTEKGVFFNYNARKLISELVNGNKYFCSIELFPMVGIISFRFYTENHRDRYSASKKMAIRLDLKEKTSKLDLKCDLGKRPLKMKMVNGEPIFYCSLVNS